MKKSLNMSLLALILSVLTMSNAFGMQNWYRPGFQPKDGYTVYCNAGILPYAVDEDGNRMFLIGCEPGGSTQKGKTVGVDFGGKRDHDESPIETAVREFSEETRGIMGWMWTRDRLTIDDYAKIAHDERIARSMNFIRGQLTLSDPIISIMPNHANKTYMIYHEYLVEIDYISPVDMLKLPFEHGVEKTDYRWVSATELLRLIPEKKVKFDYASVVLPHPLGDIPLRFPFVGLLHHHKKQIETVLETQLTKLQNIQNWNGPSLVPPLVVPEKAKKTEEIPDTGPVVVKASRFNLAYGLTALAVVVGSYAMYHWLNPKDDEAGDDEEEEETAVQ